MIPTAEEWEQQWQNEALAGLRQNPVKEVPLQDKFIEFAKMHVKAALKSAAEKAETEYEPHWSGEQEGSSYINKDSILNAYNLDNIK